MLYINAGTGVTDLTSVTGIITSKTIASLLLIGIILILLKSLKSHIKKTDTV